MAVPATEIGGIYCKLVGVCRNLDLRRCQAKLTRIGVECKDMGAFAKRQNHGCLRTVDDVACSQLMDTLLQKTISFSIALVTFHRHDGENGANRHIGVDI